MVYFYC